MAAGKKATPAKGKAAARPRTAVALKRTTAGQPFVSSGLCIATSRTDGRACCRRVGAPSVPYCSQHMRTGDPSLRTVKHPRAGKILIAARALPKGYRMALWGKLKKHDKVSDKGMEWAFDIRDGWMLDPTPCKASMLQYCACPGPNEAAAVNATTISKTTGGKYGSWAFITGRPVPRSWQITMQYGDTSKGSDEFFRERGIVRLDVGTKLYPAIRRKDAEPQQ